MPCRLRAAQTSFSLVDFSHDFDMSLTIKNPDSGSLGFLWHMDVPTFSMTQVIENETEQK